MLHFQPLCQISGPHVRMHIHASGYENVKVDLEAELKYLQGNFGSESCSKILLKFLAKLLALMFYHPITRSYTYVHV